MRCTLTGYTGGKGVNSNNQLSAKRNENKHTIVIISFSYDMSKHMHTYITFTCCGCFKYRVCTNDVNIWTKWIQLNLDYLNFKLRKLLNQKIIDN